MPFQMGWSFLIWILDLYNALNDTDYTNTDDLEITTIEDVFYLTDKNNLSMIIEDTLELQLVTTTA